MNFLAELKRRNVIRVALAYAVVAWFIVQAADVLLGNFGAPSWVFKTVTSLLALGFPLVLFLSWVYDLTPGGLQKTDDADAAGVATPNIGRGIRAALMAGLALLAGAAAWLTFRGDDLAPTARQTAGGAADAATRSTQPIPAPRGLRFSIPMPDGLEIDGPIAISRDGRQIAFAARDAGGESHVYLRRLDDFEPRQVDGSRDGGIPFFSPDGTAVGFFARNTIWRTATDGGPPTQLRAASGMRGADWMDDDTIVYSEGLGSSIKRMSAEGSALNPVTTLGTSDYAHVWPQSIPGTNQLLFTAWGGGDLEGAQIVDITTSATRALSYGPNGAPARWSVSGHLLFENWSDGLFAARFDPASNPSVSLGGARFLLGEVHHLGSSTRSVFALSDNGTFAYVPATQNDRRLVRIQADGSTTTILDQSAIDYASLSGSIAMSRDGRLALIGNGGDIVLVDLERKLPRRLLGDGNDGGAAWSPDGREVYFNSNREDRWKIWKRPIDDSAPPTLAVEHEHAIGPFSIGPGGEIVFSVTDPATRGDIWLQDPSGTQRALLQTEFGEVDPAFSPEGGLLAYVSDVSGSNEVYLLAASGKGVPVQVSTGGGIAPNWSQDGSTLLYRKGRTVLQVAIDDGRPVGEATQRFAASNLSGGDAYALAPDGNSLLAVQLGDGAIPREIRVITDFFDEIERATAEGAKP